MSDRTSSKSSKRSAAAYLTRETEAAWRAAERQDAAGDPGRALRRCRAWAEWRAGVLGHPPIPARASFSIRQGQGPVTACFALYEPPHGVEGEGGRRRIVAGRTVPVAEIPLPWHAMPEPGHLTGRTTPLPGVDAGPAAGDGTDDADPDADGAAGAARDGDGGGGGPPWT